MPPYSVLSILLTHFSPALIVSHVVQVDIENARQGPLDERLKAIDAVSLEKKRDLTVSAARKNREGNKGTRSGHD